MRMTGSRHPLGPLGEEELDLAALYALGALPEDERVRIEASQAGRETFWSEVRTLESAAHRLAGLLPHTGSRGDLWRRVQERIRAGACARVPSQVWRAWPADRAQSMHLTRAAAGEFERTDLPGIEVRRLHVDEASDRISMLVRMAPGAAYPAHRHGGPEECLVLSGDLSVGDAIQLGPGDYQRMDCGSVHEVQSTQAGCLLFVVSSRHDEILGVA
jgi:putative transcriptional regulator